MSQHDTLTLEPCPFCGNEAHFVDDLIIVYASCPNCGATGAYSSYRSGAAEAWNRRAALSATQPAQAAQSVPGVNKAVQLIPGMTKEQFAYVNHCALEVDAAKAETARLLAENAALKAQAAQGEPAEHWHRLYLEKCQQYNDRVAQLGGVIEGLEAEAAQGAGEVGEYLANVDEFGGVRWFGCPPPHGTKLYTQPAAGADVVPAQPAPVVPGKPFTGAQRMRLWQNTEKGKSAVSLAAFERIVQTVEAAHRITAAPTPPAQAAVAARDASLAAIHCRLTRGGHIDSHTISTIVAECERALPALATHQQRQDGATVQKGKK